MENLWLPVGFFAFFFQLWKNEQSKNTTWTQRMTYFTLPKTQRVHLKLQTHLDMKQSHSVSSLSLQVLPEESDSCSKHRDTELHVQKPSQLSVSEWHFPFMCLCCFGTQLANWPLIRRAASRAKTVTVERSVVWDKSSCSGSPHRISLCCVKAIIVLETYWGGGDASAGIHFGSGLTSM